MKPVKRCRSCGTALNDRGRCPAEPASKKNGFFGCERNLHPSVVNRLVLSRYHNKLQESKGIPS